MKVFTTGRRGGKTTRMLEWMKWPPEGEHRVCVSPTLVESRRVQRLGVEAGLESWQFVSVSEVMPGAWSRALQDRGGRIVLGFDNIDLILQVLFHRPVGMVTATTDA